MQQRALALGAAVPAVAVARAEAEMEVPFVWDSTYSVAIENAVDMNC